MMPEQIAAPAESTLEPICPRCGYDLRSIASDRCPECGLIIDRTAMSVSRIPWTHRRSIGRWRAYWRTNLLAIFRPRKLADEIARPVSLSDSQSFRHVTVFIAWATVLLSFIVLVVVDRKSAFEGLRESGSHLGWWLETTSVAAGLLACWAALLMISGAGSYFFHPRDLPTVVQNRGIALSYYTCAPLAWLWLPALCCGIAGAISPLDFVQAGPGEKWVNGLVFAAGAFGVVIALACWSAVVRLMARVTRCGIGRAIAMVIYLPIAWLICAAVAMLIPATALYLSLVYLSFR
jgi:hypothetical protein